MNRHLGLPCFALVLTGFVLSSPARATVSGQTFGPAKHATADVPPTATPYHEFCFGDSTDIPCPCGNFGQPGHGCDNSSATGGARLTGLGEGKVSGDTLVLSVTGERPNAFSMVGQGTLSTAPRVFGDGIGCIGGQIKRLYYKHAVEGAFSAPEAGDPTISARSASLGDVLTPGANRVYTVFYRDPDPTFCSFPEGATFNVSNAFMVSWGT